MSHNCNLKAVGDYTQVLRVKGPRAARRHGAHRKINFRVDS